MFDRIIEKNNPDRREWNGKLGIFFGWTLFFFCYKSRYAHIYTQDMMSSSVLNVNKIVRIKMNMLQAYSIEKSFSFVSFFLLLSLASHSFSFDDSKMWQVETRKKKKKKEKKSKHSVPIQMKMIVKMLFFCFVLWRWVVIVDVYVFFFSLCVWSASIFIVIVAGGAV